MSNDDINNYVPSLLNPRAVLKTWDQSLTQFSTVSRSSLSLRKFTPKSTLQNRLGKSYENNVNNENNANVRNSLESDITAKCMPVKTIQPKTAKEFTITDNISIDSLGISAIKDCRTDSNDFEFVLPNLLDTTELQCNQDKPTHASIRYLSSATELREQRELHSESTLILEQVSKPTVLVSLGVHHCDNIDVSTNDSVIKRISVKHRNNDLVLQCEVIEGSNVATESELDENMNEINESLSSTPTKRSAVAVNFEIKKKKLTHATEDRKVLILNTSDIKKISHVIVQPPNYKIVKGKKRKAVNTKSQKNGICDGLKQKSIDSFFPKCSSVLKTIKVSDVRSLGDGVDVTRDEEEMSKVPVADVIRRERVKRSPQRAVRTEDESPTASRRDSPRLEAKPSPTQERNRSNSSQSTRRNVESIQFSLYPKSVNSSKKTSAKVIPQYKIVAGTHFAVDAFSYGEIPGVKHYFLTHFHSDHYAGLKKTFNKLLFCSKITAELCSSRLGVNPKCIHVLNVEETIHIEGVEVTALEANHCPGALMLAFTLPNGKTMLHTGDFRATPIMESYPVFWNKDIHTIYLDTTYCNPRYDFPTQEQSLEMALYILRQKKLALENAGKKFSSVLVVCGTYTIGKEKFFLGMSRRLGCAVWACPEKQRVLDALEARGARAPPHACQLHVVPMRDLTHEKLRSYLESLKGAFSEVVAFKPSGWENGKTGSDERDLVTIHGIPYSEHSSFSELIRFVKFLKPKQVIPTVDITGGIRAVQKYFPCPLVCKEDSSLQSKLTDFFSIQSQLPQPAVT